MTSAPLHTLVLSAALLAAAVVPSAHARPVACDGTGVAKCVIATERIQPSQQGFSGGTHTPNLHAPATPPVQSKLTRTAAWSAPAMAAEESTASLSPSSDAAPGGDRPYLALLLATVGIVAFMAHRRSGS